MEKRFIFTVHLSGYGDTPEEAWDDAVEGFSQDPGNFDEDEYKEVD